MRCVALLALIAGVPSYSTNTVQVVSSSLVSDTINRVRSCDILEQAAYP